MIRFRLLCSSLSPLLVILGVRLWSAHTVVAATLLVAAVASVGSLLLLMRARERLSAQRYTLTTVHDESGQVPAYLVTYLLPFVTLNIAGWDDFFGYLLLAAVLIILVVRTDLVYVQPVLLAIGWHLYRAEVENGFSEMVFISNRDLRVGHRVAVVGVGGPVSRVVSIED